MARVTKSYLKNEIKAAKANLDHNIVELQKAEANIEDLKESIAANKGAISAFEFLLEGKLEEEEPETPKPDDPDAEKVGKEA